MPSLRLPHGLLALFVFLVAAGASAQTGSLAGRVTDRTGAGVDNVTVVATAEAGDLRRTATTASDGAYTIADLAAGTYTVEARRDGVATGWTGRADVVAGQTATLDVEIDLYLFRETVVVTASGTNADADAEEIERWQAGDLADVFRTIPSVSVGGSVGIAQKIYLRGLEDTQLNVTVDGAQLTGTLFHHIGRVQIEPELLEEVEVQAGAGEATAGFGAIGGAIRFRTKDAEDLLAPGRRVGALVRGSVFTNEGYKTSLSAFGRVADGWSVLGSAVYVDRGTMTDGDGTELFGTAADQFLGFAKVTGDITSRQRLTLSYEHRDESGEFGARPNWPVMADEPLFAGDAGRRTAVANYLIDGGPLALVEATAYATRAQFEQDRSDRWGLYGADIDTYGFGLRNTTALGANELIYGVEARLDRVASEYLADPEVWADWAWDPEVGRFEEAGDLFGAYLQGHARPLAPVLLSAGVRYDAYSLDQVTYGNETSSDGISGNVGVLYEPHRFVDLTAGVAQALRGKEVGDAFTLEHRPGSVSIDPNLEPERVTNAEVGAAFDSGRWFASAALYQMTIDDVILDQLGNNGVEGQDAIFYENVGELATAGLELGVGFASERFRARLFYTTYDAELNDHTVEGYEEIGLANASGDTWDLSLFFAPTRTVELGWNTRVVQDLDDIAVLYRAVEIGWIDELQTVDKPGYAVHDLAARWSPRLGGALGQRVELGLTVRNLFDAQYRDHASVADYNAISGWEGVAGLNEAGRDVRLSVSLGL